MKTGYGFANKAGDVIEIPSGYRDDIFELIKSADVLLYENIFFEFTDVMNDDFIINDKLEHIQSIYRTAFKAWKKAGFDLAFFVGQSVIRSTPETRPNILIHPTMSPTPPEIEKVNLRSWYISSKLPADEKYNSLTIASIQGDSGLYETVEGKKCDFAKFDWADIYPNQALMNLLLSILKRWPSDYGEMICLFTAAIVQLFNVSCSVVMNRAENQTLGSELFYLDSNNDIQELDKNNRRVSDFLNYFKPEVNT